MTQPTTPNKDNEALGAFAGIIMLIVILSIVFGLTTPNVSSNDVADTEDETEVALVDEATAEATEESTEEIVVAEVTDVVTQTPTEAPTQAVVVAATDTPASEEATEEVAESATEIAEATAEVAGADAQAVSGDYDPEMVAHGEQMFIVCTACHGPDGRGIPGLGKDLVEGEFATTATDEELHALILNGRPIWDPANTTMVDMPPKGGNPALTDEDIDAIIAYIRSLQTP